MKTLSLMGAPGSQFLGCSAKPRKKIIALVKRKRIRIRRSFGSHSLGRLLSNRIIRIAGRLIRWRSARARHIGQLLLRGLLVVPIVLTLLLVRIEQSVSNERAGRPAIHFRPKRLMPDLPQPVRILFNAIQFAADRMTSGVHSGGLQINCGRAISSECDNSGNEPDPLGGS